LDFEIVAAREREEEVAGGGGYFFSNSKGLFGGLAREVCGSKKKGFSSLRRTGR
jgi:hypothetical protein